MSVEEREDVPAGTPPERGRRGRRWRGFTGALAAGLAVLSVIVLGAGLICAFVGAPGPGVASLIGHPIAAIAALAAQRVVDRRDGRVAVAAGIFVLADALFVLAYFWWW